MTATVNVFFHNGLATAPVVAASSHFASDSVQLLTQPYISRQQLSVDTGSAQSTTANLAGAGTQLARIEVQPGKAMYMEINPPNRSQAADNGSPMISGNTLVRFGEGWTISFLEAVIA